MAKNKKVPPRDETRAAAEYYKLNKQAVEDLVTADVSNSPEVSEEELRKYRSGPKLNMAGWLKIVLIKAWFAASVCYYFMWGLGVYLPNILDQIVVTGLALGFVTDILVNNLLRFMEKTPGGNARWMMFGRKGYMSLPLNVLYGLALMGCTVMTYETVNRFVNLLRGVEDTVSLGVEPIIFGVFIVLWDAIFLMMKRVFRQILADAKQKVRSGR